jgi:hypothetical protein
MSQKVFKLYLQRLTAQDRKTIIVQTQTNQHELHKDYIALTVEFAACCKGDDFFWKMGQLTLTSIGPSELDKFNHLYGPRCFHAGMLQFGQVKAAPSGRHGNPSWRPQACCNLLHLF